MAETKEKLRVFLSYARRDAAPFAEELLQGLKLIGFDAFLDRHDIAAGEDWEARLGGLIRSADTIVYVLTQASASSERCAWEIKQAEALSKRVIPIMLLDVAEADTPPSLKRLNYIFFTEGHSFVKGLSDLGEALSVDLNWIREHTRLGDLAQRWDERQRNEVLLLRGPELEAARVWLGAWKAPAPEPTDLHRAFIHDSDVAEGAIVKRERARRRTLLIAMSGALVVFAVLTAIAGFSYFQAYDNAKRLYVQQQIADQERDSATRSANEAHALTQRINSVIGEISRVAEADPNASDQLLFLSYAAPLGLSTNSIQLIYNFEGFSTRAYRDPSGALTVGGYDFSGDPATCRTDWAGIRDASNTYDMAEFCGATATASALNLTVKRRDVLRVFGQRQLPRYVALTRRLMPGSENLRPDCFGALISITYNMGPNNPKLRPIRDLIAQRRFADVPAQIRALAATTHFAGLQRRRLAEADLFEQGLHAAN